MESEEEMAHTARNENQLQKKKEDCIEPSSDRESSVESFHTNKSEFSTAAESELIDVDEIELSDEESWLYKSPKKLPSTDKVLSTYKWLEKEEDNLDVQDTKDALVRKLNQLDKRDAVFEKPPKENGNSLKAPKESASNSNLGTEVVIALHSSKESKMCTTVIPRSIEEIKFVKGKENDILDVHKIAQLQEESLRQSTQRFLDLVGKKSLPEKNFLSNSKVIKPASVEALNVCNGKLDDETTYTPLVPMQAMKKPNHFGSSSFLHKLDVHRNSLPNINPGYYSLQMKKSRKHIDQKLPCPLPLSPSNSRLPLNGAGFHASPSGSQCKLTSLTDHCDSCALPSSYRIHSMSNSSSPKDLNALSPPCRESECPSLSNSRSASTIRRESAPSNGSKYLSPLSSPTIYQRNNVSSSFFQSPQQSRRHTPQSTEYHRNASRSPSWRQPLSTVHNRSPKRGNSPASPRKEDLRGFIITSNIPNPGSTVRSGIPVPSSYSSKMNSDDESWSHDCF
ncbi:uncharacterized protein TNCT_272851 [Trichonephila clavata]|uniref:Uncharacterized protein n=1 Tax=Trichonephila clavata TaxID=2740835 RepID=A0A8X6LJX8_TRICU|nr:uncharacterized protein TNCT_272851 [Trichonephila clavata]